MQGRNREETRKASRADQAVSGARADQGTGEAMVDQGTGEDHGGSVSSGSPRRSLPWPWPLARPLKP